MPLLADRVKESTTTTGTGTITLAGAPAGFQSFNQAFANGNTVYYVIQGGAEWEIGIGTVGTGTLARTTVLQSSNGDALVPFSAGVKDVFVSYVADRAVTTSDAATLTNKTIDDYTNNVGANSTHFRIKATGTISKGTVVKATGFNPGEQAIEVAVVSSATDLVLGISEQALTAGQFGLAVVIGELFDVNTNGLTVGGMLYSNGSGGFTQTKPTSGMYQPLGWVVRANSSNGVIAVNIVSPLSVEASTNTANTVVLRDGSGNFAAGTITATLSGTATQVSNALTAGTYLTSGGTYNGSAARTFAVDATDANTASKVVARDASGNFSAGTITATLNGAAPAGSLSGTTLAANVVTSSLTAVGTLTSGAIGAGFTAIADSSLATITTAGKVSNSATTAASANTANAIVARDASGNFAAGTITAALSGNASTATALQTARNINGVAFNGTADITVTADAGTLTGNTLASGVTASSLTSVGTLSSLTVSGNLTVDTNTLFVDATNNRVGIGTVSPSQALDISGADGVRARILATSAGTPGLTIVSGGVSAYTLRTVGTDSSFRIDQDGTDRIVLQSGGNLAVDTNTLYVDAANNRVGVGTASPGYTFDLRSVTDASISIRNDADGSTNPTSSANIRFWRHFGVNEVASIRAVGTSLTGNPLAEAALVFSTSAGTGSATERARIDAFGNLGLGVTPSAWGGGGRAFELGAIGNGLQGRNFAYLTLTQNAWYNASAQWIYGSTAAASRYDQDAGAHKWYTAPSGTAGAAITFSQVMTLDASGNLIVGATSGPEAFNVKRGAGLSAYAEFAGNNNALGSASMLYGQDGGGNGYVWNRANFPVLFGTNGAERARITSGGKFVVGKTSATVNIETVGAGVDGNASVSVGTSATTIYTIQQSITGTMCVVFGDNGTVGFMDLVFFYQGQTPKVVTSQTIYGSPAARTYSASTTNLQCAMASGSAVNVRTAALTPMNT